MAENAWRYGFILRYPQGKEDITGIDYEPWHYRYVGKEVAKQIYEEGITWKNMLGKGIKETYKNQTAEEDEYLAESLAAEFDRISFRRKKKIGYIGE